MTLPPKRITWKEAAEQLGVSMGTLANWRTFGIGPRWDKMGRSVLYYQKSIDRFKGSALCKSCKQTVPLKDRKT